MDLLEDRKGDDSPIFRAYVDRVMKERSKKINAEQQAGYSTLTDPSFRGRSFASDGTQLTYTHSRLYRFVDMKRLRAPKSDTKYVRKKRYEFHNRVIMGHFAGMRKDLTYGLTEQIRAELKAELDNKIISPN